jgi:hypothetical protein
VSDGGRSSPPPREAGLKHDAAGSLAHDGSSPTSPQGPLVLSPLNQTVTVTYGEQSPTITYKATAGGEPVSASFAIDLGQIATIAASTGVLTPTGKIGGTANVTATSGTLKATTTVTVVVQLTENGGGLPDGGASADAGAGGYGGVGGTGPGGAVSMATETTLQGAPTADPGLGWLYPYDQTVWPQGLLAPLLQWAAPRNYDGLAINLKENGFVYTGYFAANATPYVNAPIPESAWDALSYSNQGESVAVTLTFSANGVAYGPLTETWMIAEAPLQGTIYYNSYGTALVKNSNSNDSYQQQYGAGTLAIASGATGPTLVAGIAGPESTDGGTGPSGCRVCHTVSLNGTTLLTQENQYQDGNDDYDPTVLINPGNDPTAGAGTPIANNMVYPAVYKDGTMALSSAGGAPFGNGSSALYSLPTGALVTTTTGLPTNFQAALPAFSPDGTKVSFNFWGGSFSADAGTPDGGTLQGDQQSLAILDFDGTSGFSSPRILYTPASGTAVTFSSFFPNSQAIVFEVELSNPSTNWGFTWGGNTAELWWLDLASGQAHPLDALNGYGAGGAIYLPAGGSHTPAQDVTLNYEPTVAPVASGGYAWVVFTTRRMYGNIAQLPPWTSDPRDYPWLDEVTDKKLWVAAIDLNAPPGTDPSHPAFYLPAQELHAGNARGFWALEPCRANGSSCLAGDQCCSGTCEAVDGGLACGTPPPGCAGLGNKCTSSTDCCGYAEGVSCINDYCAESSPAK